MEQINYFSIFFKLYLYYFFFWIFVILIISILLEILSEGKIFIKDFLNDKIGVWFLIIYFLLLLFFFPWFDIEAKKEEYLLWKISKYDFQLDLLENEKNKIERIVNNKSYTIQDFCNENDFVLYDLVYNNLHFLKGKIYIEFLKNNESWPYSSEYLNWICYIRYDQGLDIKEYYEEKDINKIKISLKYQKEFLKDIINSVKLELEPYQKELKNLKIDKLIDNK